MKSTSRTLVQAALAIGFVLAGTSIAMPSQSTKLVALMEKDMGGKRPGGCPSKWCACYMDLILGKAGYAQRGSHRARDFASYGKNAKPMAVGAIMVMPNHVGVVAGQCDDGRVLLISGNYSHRVGLGCYSPKKAIAWRAPVRG